MHQKTASELTRLVLAGGSADREHIAQTYFANGAPRKLRSLAQRLQGRTPRVLDVGCGYGTYLAHFADSSVGVDRDPERVAFVRSLGLTAEVRDVEAADWSTGLGEFDLIWLCDLLPHLRDPATFLGALTRLLAPEGQVVISDWVWPESRVLSWMARRLPGAAANEVHPEHLHRMTERRLAKWLGTAGLQIEDSWMHSLRPAWLGACVRPFWPPRTLVALQALE